jgi:hypothetical protein
MREADDHDPKSQLNKRVQAAVRLLFQHLARSVGKDEGEGKFDGESHLVSLSFSSDAEYLAMTYIIVDSKVKQNCSLETESLLQAGIIKAVTSAWEEQVVKRSVLFPVFTRYFLARKQSFQRMIEYLLKHRETDRNPPLVLGADVPRLRHIANKRMGYLRATYCLFRDTVSRTEKDSIALITFI